MIISIGNSVWIALMVCTVAATYGMYALLKNRPEEQIRSWLFRFGVLIFVLYGIQRYYMFRDPEFLDTYGSSFRDILV